MSKLRIPFLILAKVNLLTIIKL